MARWIIAVAVGLLMLCEMLFNVPNLFAQAPDGPFDRMSPGNQKAVRALFEAQRTDLPPGTRPLTQDEIAARKQNGEGWGRIFDGMKSRGLVDAKNFGQVINIYNHRHQVSSGGPVVSTANGQTHDRGTGVSVMSAEAHGQAGGANGAGHGRGK